MAKLFGGYLAGKGGSKPESYAVCSMLEASRAADSGPTTQKQVPRPRASRVSESRIAGHGSQATAWRKMETARPHADRRALWKRQMAQAMSEARVVRRDARGRNGATMRWRDLQDTDKTRLALGGTSSDVGGLKKK